MIDGRIHALARAHNQITEDHWGPAPLQSLIDAEAAAFMVEQDRIRSSGAPVMLNPLAYSTMALVLHELVTNAVKYGALSAEEGRVAVRWQAADGRFRLRGLPSGVTLLGIGSAFWGVLAGSLALLMQHYRPRA